MHKPLPEACTCFPELRLKISWNELMPAAYFFNHEPHKQTWRGLIARNPHGLNTDNKSDGSNRSVGSVGSVRSVGEKKKGIGMVLTAVCQ